MTSFLNLRYSTYREDQVHEHVPSEKAYLFETIAGSSTEVEYAELLYTLSRATKATNILETGTDYGSSTRALIDSVKQHCGKITSIDLVDKSQYFTEEDKKTVTLVMQDSLNYLQTVNDHYDFAYLDSDLGIRADELEILLSRCLMLKGSLVCIHDTSKVRTMTLREKEIFHQKFNELINKYKLSFIEFSLSRGLFVIQMLSGG
jgi:predicted O-methyltransferase YrrM